MCTIGIENRRVLESRTEEELLAVVGTNGHVGPPYRNSLQTGESI